MKVCVLGNSSTPLCQIGALREGVTSLGHTPIVDFLDPDTSFVFVGNTPYDSYTALAQSRQRKVIFNVLDCPFWVPEWPQLKAKWAEQLPLAHRVTCISKTVQSQIKSGFGINAEVIYYPAKNVRPTGVRKYPQFKVALVGRVSDPSKRSGMAVQVLVRAGVEESEVAVIGPEYFGYGTKMGVVSDEVLNDIYNSVDYVLMLSQWEGLGLPALEAAMAGAIPIVCPDLSVFDEFWAESPLGINYQTLNSTDSIATFIRSIENDKEWKTKIRQDMLVWGDRVVRPLVDRTEVAKRILAVAL